MNNFIVSISTCVNLAGDFGNHLYKKTPIQWSGFGGENIMSHEVKLFEGS